MFTHIQYVLHIDRLQDVDDVYTVAQIQLEGIINSCSSQSVFSHQSAQRHRETLLTLEQLQATIQLPIQLAVPLALGIIHPIYYNT